MPPWRRRPGRVHTSDVAETTTDRVFVPDVRGGDRYLRVTWHRDTATVVLSHWNGDVCVGSTPVAVADAAKLIELFARALGEAARTGRATAERSGLGRSAWDQLRDRLRPRLAEVIDATARFLPHGRDRSGRRESL